MVFSWQKNSKVVSIVDPEFFVLLERQMAKIHINIVPFVGVQKKFTQMSFSAFPSSLFLNHSLIWAHCEIILLHMENISKMSIFFILIDTFETETLRLPLNLSQF